MRASLAALGLTAANRTELVLGEVGVLVHKVELDVAGPVRQRVCVPKDNLRRGGRLAVGAGDWRRGCGAYLKVESLVQDLRAAARGQGTAGENRGGTAAPEHTGQPRTSLARNTTTGLQYGSPLRHRVYRTTSASAMTALSFHLADSGGVSGWGGRRRQQAAHPVFDSDSDATSCPVHLTDGTTRGITRQMGRCSPEALHNGAEGA